MKFVLGIDTGGTYTDACLVDMTGKSVVGHGKALTNNKKLIDSIEQALQELELSTGVIDWKAVKQVSLSTTLATNSIVEGKGCRVGLIAIGKKPDQATPATSTFYISGGHSNSGDPLTEIKEEDMEKAWSYLDPQADAFAVAGFMSIRNPAHERAVEDWLKKRTKKPIICTHQLSSDLGFHERSVTAVLNARILPLIDDLLKSAEIVFKSRGIEAPIMVVKGDGTLFPLELAQKYPVETVLSGPAASVIGACFLTGLNKATIVDLGGTTMDIASVNGNLFASRNEGITIGGWKTKVKTIHSESVGLGGDSHITLGKSQLQFGPRRVIPLSWAAHYYPEIITELKVISKHALSAQRGLYEFIIARPNNNSLYLDESTQSFLKFLGDRPLSIRQAGELKDISPGLLIILRLEEQGLINRISLTPTDVLHVLGKLEIWNAVAPKIALSLFSNLYNKDPEELASYLYEQFVLRIAEVIMTRLLEKELALKDTGKNKAIAGLLEKIFKQKPKVELDIAVSPKKNLVAVGAPVEAYFPRVAELLGGKLKIPPHVEVANAAGAAIAPVFKEVAVIVRPYLDSFSVHSSLKRTEHEKLDDAIDEAVKLAKLEIENYFNQAGIDHPEIVIQKKVNRYNTAGGSGASESIFIDANVIVQGVGFPVTNPFAINQEA